MNDVFLIALLAVFLVHLLVFGLLGWRRRQAYYLALVITFSLLSLSIALRLWWPDLTLGQRPLFAWLRALAWVSAAVSIGWTLTRILIRRKAQSGRQNCS
jgi:hypothetical protein